MLSVPGPIIGIGASLGVAYVADRYKKCGATIIFVGIWTVVGLIAIYELPISPTNGQWSFYAALVFTQAAPNWQALNVTWISLNSRTPARRAISYAMYIGCSNLGGTYGPFVFAAKDAPKYHQAWSACLSLAAVWLALSIFQLLQYSFTNRWKRAKWEVLSSEEKADYIHTTADTSGNRLDFVYRL